MRLALSVGRLDFWNLTNGRRDDDLTPYEEAVWRVYEIVEPFGEPRADMRMAWQTLHILQGNSPKLFGDERNKLLLKNLTGYAKVENDHTEKLTPDQAAAMGKAAFARVGL